VQRPTGAHAEGRVGGRLLLGLRSAGSGGDVGGVGWFNIVLRFREGAFVLVVFG
jgi:hypothetical protein